jgi:DHA1 family inner membrane transport protein
MDPVAKLSEGLSGQPIVDSLYARRPAAALLAVGSIGAAALCFVTGENLIVGLLPQVSAALHTSLSATGLLVTFYAIVVVLVSAPLTQLTRTITRRWLLSGLLAMFVLGTFGVVLAPSYGWVLAARIVIALAQALFWSIAPVTAAGLFSPQARARAVAGVYVGTSGAVIVGIPAGTWIGQQFGWRVPFLALAGVGLLCLIGTLALLPTSKPSESHAAAGSAPDARRYRVIVVTTALAVAAFFVVFTYVSPFLTRVSGLPSHAVAPMLLVGGVAGTLGIAGLGAFYERHPTTATILPVALLVVSLSCFFVFGKAGYVVAIFLALDGIALGGLTIAMQTTVLVVAPRSADIATAWYSAAFNVGIGGGPLIGAVVLSTWGLRYTPLVAALLAALALAVLLSGTNLRPRRLALHSGRVS